MKTRTNLHAGRAPTEREMLKCLEDKKSLYQKIDALESRLNAPTAVATAAQPAYGVYPDWSGYCG